jgi:hypothetical protein
VLEQLGGRVCSCRFGYGGPDCSVPLMPACRLTADEPHAHQACWNQPSELDLPLACLCFRQCENYTSMPDVDTQFDMWGQQTVLPNEKVRCYERTETPPEQQLSRLPGAFPQCPLNCWPLLLLERLPDLCEGLCVLRGPSDTFHRPNPCQVC